MNGEQWNAQRRRVLRLVLTGVGEARRSAILGSGCELTLGWALPEAVEAGLSMAEIARLTGLSVRSIEGRLHSHLSTENAIHPGGGDDGYR